MTRLRNLTPHVITLFDGGHIAATLVPAGPVPRVTIERERVGAVHDSGAAWPVQSERLGSVSDLPSPDPDVLLVVSRLVLERCTDRTDLVTPTDLVRDEQGRIIGCRALAQRTAPDPAPARTTVDRGPTMLSRPGSRT